MKIQFTKLHPEAKAPQQGREGDACWDLTAVSRKQMDEYLEYGTGIAVKIPEDHVGLIFPRSSITTKELMLKNAVGVIDATYRGEIKLRFYELTAIPADTDVYAVGDRIGQIMIVPRPYLEWEEVTELDSTERGEGGFGSSGQ